MSHHRSGPCPPTSTTVLVSKINPILCSEQRRCENEEVIANRFFAFYTIVAASSHIWGNIISAVVLKAPPHKDTGEILIPEARLQVCGSKYCNEPFANFSSSSNVSRLNVPSYYRTVLMGLGLDVFYFAMFKVTDQPSGDQITSLCYVYLICTIFPVFSIAIFLDKVPRPVTGSGRNPPLCGLLVATLHQLRDYRQLLLIPITTYAGLAGAFIHSDFSKVCVHSELHKLVYPNELWFGARTRCPSQCPAVQVPSRVGPFVKERGRRI